MSTFATLLAAEERVRAKVGDGTWVEAYAMAKANGQPMVRFLRYMNGTDVVSGTFDQQNKIGAWDETIDDSVA